MPVPAKPAQSELAAPQVAFIGGGNMASAIIGGLIAAGHPRERVLVIDPHAQQAVVLRERFSVRVEAAPTSSLAEAQIVVWAVKPQIFNDAARPCREYVQDALQLSVMAGIRTDSISRATGSNRVVRAMPNTPALIGEGIAGLFATETINVSERATLERLLAPTGETLFVDSESDLDAITALSGSGPAYVFFFLEAMIEAAIEMGLNERQGRLLAEATFRGATSLARTSTDAPEILRAQVTSKGGTTHAAITSMEASGVKGSIVTALQAAKRRARELADQFAS